MKKIIPILVLLFMSVLRAHAGDLADVRDAGVLRFGVAAGSYPFAFYDPNDDLTGIDVKLMESIAGCLKTDLEVYEMSYDSLVDSLKNGQSDVIGGAFSKPSAEKARIDFTKIYYSTGAVFVSRIDHELPEPLTSESFAGMKIGVREGTGFEAWLKGDFADKGTVSPKDIYTFGKVDDAMRSLNRKQIDLVFMDANVYLSRFEKDPDYRAWQFGSAEDNYAFGIRKGSDLKDELDRCLSDMLTDGTAQQIADRFFSENYMGEMPLIHWTAKTAVPEPTATPDPDAVPVAEVSVVEPKKCTYSMAYITDVSIPDGQQIFPGVPFTKTWRLRNDGTCIWTPDYILAFDSGTPMSAATMQYLGQTVNPGDTADISVNLVSPADPGNYQGNWQLKTPQGIDIGDPVWVRITVPNPQVSPNATPTVDYGPVQQTVKPVIDWFYPSFLTQPAGSCVILYWGISAFSTAELFVDDVSVYFGPEETYTKEVCNEVLDKGQHEIRLCVYGSGDRTCQTILYTTY